MVRPVQALSKTFHEMLRGQDTATYRYYLRLVEATLINTFRCSEKPCNRIRFVLGFLIEIFDHIVAVPHGHLVVR